MNSHFCAFKIAIITFEIVVIFRSFYFHAIKSQCNMHVIAVYSFSLVLIVGEHRVQNKQTKENSKILINVESSPRMWCIQFAVRVPMKCLCCANLWTNFDGFLYLQLDWIGGYGGGGFIQVWSGRRMCLRSDENSAKYCSAGITRKNLLSSNAKVE